MKRLHVASVLFAAAAGMTACTYADDPVLADDPASADGPAPDDGPGWTGVTNPQDVIFARQELMIEIENLMQPIDSITVGEPADPAELRSTAHTIAHMLLALPHLFPPTTNLYDPAAETPQTIALPAIWQSFPTFYQLAEAAAAAADAMAETADDAALPAASRNLRAACDACHVPFLRPYVAAKVEQSDLDFDFDSVLPQN
jgi:cytochrome c556